jgi:hypothetical protein
MYALFVPPRRAPARPAPPAIPASAAAHRCPGAAPAPRALLPPAQLLRLGQQPQVVRVRGLALRELLHAGRQEVGDHEEHDAAPRGRAAHHRHVAPRKRAQRARALEVVRQPAQEPPGARARARPLARRAAWLQRRPWARRAAALARRPRALGAHTRRTQGLEHARARSAQPPRRRIAGPAPGGRTGGRAARRPAAARRRPGSRGSCRPRPRAASARACACSPAGPRAAARAPAAPTPATQSAARASAAGTRSPAPAPACSPARSAGAPSAPAGARHRLAPPGALMHHRPAQLGRSRGSPGRRAQQQGGRCYALPGRAPAQQPGRVRARALGAPSRRPCPRASRRRTARRA